MMILMLFHLFLHFSCFWENSLPESDSAGKRGVKRSNFGRSGKFQKNIRKFYFARRLPEPEGEPEVGHLGPTPAPGAGPT